MSRPPNWEKIKQQERLHYVPSPRAEPATQRQLNFLRDLCQRKNQPMARMPKTKAGASTHISRLIELPDVEHSTARMIEPEEVKRPSFSQETVSELRERLPQLTPMDAHSLVQLFAQLDPLGMAFTLDALYHEQAPEERDELILWLLRMFLEHFAPVNNDDTAMVGG